MPHRRPVLALCLFICTAACPLPIGRTESPSAPISGQIFQSDGTPLPRATIAVSTEWGDTSCTKAILRSTTDSMGGFHMPGTQKHYSVTVVIPNLDVMPPRYFLCVGIADTLRQAYVGQGSLYPFAEPDSITCIEWLWERRVRLACSGLAQRSLATGGHWVEQDAGGWYRLILTEEPTMVPGWRHPQPRPRAYVQWVERSAAGPPYAVRATVLLDLDRNVTALWEPQLWLEKGRWYASLEGTRKAFMNDFHRAHLAYRLGPPGLVSRTELP